MLRLFFSIRLWMTIIAYYYIKENKPEWLNIPYELIFGKTKKDEVIDMIQTQWGLSGDIANYIYLGMPFVALYLAVFIITKIIGFK